MNRSDIKDISGLDHVMKWPAPDEFERHSPVTLFDGRYVELTGEPESTEPIGPWCKAREVLNAKDPEFTCPEYGPEEKVSLRGARNMLAKAGPADRTAGVN